MAEKLLPPLKPEDVHLKPAQVAAFPEYQPFRGHLLSQDGMLQTSSADPDDRPLSYRQVLSGGSIGWFNTASDKTPWAQVQLPGEGELAGIVLIGRHEYPRNDPTWKPYPSSTRLAVHRARLSAGKGTTGGGNNSLQQPRSKCSNLVHSGAHCEYLRACRRRGRETKILDYTMV